MEQKLWQKINLAYWPIYFLPFYLIRFGFFGLPTNLLEALTIFIFVAFLFIDLHSFIKQGTNFFRNYFIFLVPIAVIIIGLVIGTAKAGSYEIGLGIIKGWFIIPIMIWFLANFGVTSGDSDKETRKAFQAYLVSSVIVALFSIGFWIEGKHTYDLRLQGFYNSPNYLAMALAPGFLVGLFSYKYDKNNKYIYIAAIGALSIVIYMTHSVSSWLAIAVSIVVTLLLKKRSYYKLLILSIFIFFSIMIFWQLNQSRINQSFEGLERSSLASRLMIWNASTKIIRSDANWLWGIGPGNFQEQYLDNQKYFPPYLEWSVPHPHNLFLTFWLSSGIIGFIAFLFILINWFRLILKYEFKTPQVIAVSIMLYILIHGILDTTYFKNDLAVIFWMTFLALNAKSSPEGANNEKIN